MANILFYAPFNQRSRDTESIMLGLKKRGHRVALLTQQEGVDIIPFLNSRGIMATSIHIKGGVGILYYLKHIFFFIKYCRKLQVDFVFSHLEPANFVASIGQFFIRAQVWVCRHHTMEARLTGFDKSLYYRATYRLSRRFIVVSENAKTYMIEKEGIPASRINHINLGYDFSLFARPDPAVVGELTKSLKGHLVLITVCRFVKMKRVDLSLKVLKKLRSIRIPAKLILLGQGEEEENILTLINEMNLNDSVILPGYVKNIFSFLAVSDWLIHPSLIESSCVTTKEAALQSCPVIACEGVGDFDDYIVNEQNGFLVSTQNFVDEAVSIVAKPEMNQIRRKQIGKELRDVVMKKFLVDNALEKYNQIVSP